MLETFRRLWLGWNRALRGVFRAQSTVLMSVAYVLGLGPIAIVLKLMRRRLLDRSPADPNASTYWVPRDDGPADMARAGRPF